MFYLPDVVSSPQPTEVVTQNTYHTASVTPLRQLIRVTPVSGNPRSILLPVSLKDVKDIKTIKIINASPTIRKQSAVSSVRLTTSNRTTLQTKPILVKSTVPQDDLISVTSSKGSMSEETGDESDSQYPRLQLTRKFKICKILLLELPLGVKRGGDVQFLIARLCIWHSTYRSTYHKDLNIRRTVVFQCPLKNFYSITYLKYCDIFYLHHRK